MLQESEENMKIEEGSVCFPTPSSNTIIEFEKRWRIKLPEDYKVFLQQYNCAVPIAKSFDYRGHGYFIIRFCGIIDELKKADREARWFDIDVIDTQLDERLSVDEDSDETALLPIAGLFSDNLLCMDFRENLSSPSICIWYHEESGEFVPSTETIASSFTEFLTMLYEG